jgi:hypothetical protein
MGPFAYIRGIGDTMTTADYEDVYYRSLSSTAKLRYIIDEIATSSPPIERLLWDYMYMDQHVDYHLTEAYVDIDKQLTEAIDLIRRRIRGLNALFSQDFELPLNAAKAASAKQLIDDNTAKIKAISVVELSKTETLDIKGYCEVYFIQLKTLNKVLRAYNTAHFQNQVEYVNE